MSAWSPAKLPKLRDQTVAQLLNPASAIRRQSWPDTEAGNNIENVGRNLAVADLYWVTPEMSALAASAAETLTDLRWTVADRPSTFGLIVWDGGVWNVRWTENSDVVMPASAVSWAPHPRGLLVTLWVSRLAVADYLRDVDHEYRLADFEGVPPLMPAVADVLSVQDRFVAVGNLPKAPPAGVMPVVYATWTLMQQRGLAERVKAPVDRKIAKAYARRGEPAPEVTIVTLRRRYIPSQAEPAPDGEPSGRQYSHRWVVEGFWRDQRCGKGLTEVRRRWISAFVKGPADKPLLVKKRVNVWRR